MNLWQAKRSKRRNPRASPRRVVGVIAASGGLGASTLATALAMRGAGEGLATLLIDAHPYGGGLDVCLGLDTEPGVRWCDLASVRGDIDARAVLELLPVVRQCRVLSWDRACPAALTKQGSFMAAGLTEAAHLSVIDLPGPEAEGAPTWWGLCDDIVLVCGDGVRQVAAAAVVLERLEVFALPALAPTDATPMSPPSPRLAAVKLRVHGVVREGPGRVDRDRAAAILGLPVLAAMRRDPGVEAALTSGEPIAGRSGPVAALADGLLGDILGWADAA